MHQKGFAPIIILLTLLAAIVLYLLAQYLGIQPLTNLGLPTTAPVTCSLDAKICPDGSSVGRTGPNCEFTPCPTPNISPDWVVYTANIINFAYPLTWTLSEPEPEFITLTPPAAGEPAISIDLRIDTNYDTVLQNIKEVTDVDSITNISYTDISAMIISGKISSEFGKDTPVKYALLKKNNGAIIISLTGDEHTDTFNHLLTTIQFTNRISN